MERRSFLSAATATALALALAPHATAQGPGQGPGPGKGPGSGPGPGPGGVPGKGGGMMQHGWTRERMYGTRLMTLEERQEHMQKMWNAKTPDERTKLRDEHRKLMQERAKKQNFKIEDKEDDSYSLPSVK